MLLFRLILMAELHDFRPKLLSVELGMFLIVQALALLAAANLIVKGLAPEKMQGEAPALGMIGIAFAIAIVIMIAVLYFLKTPKTFGIFFGFMMFIGTEIFFEAFVPSLIAIVIAAIVVAVRFIKPNVITHNIAIFLTVAGISTMLGLTMPSARSVIILLIVLSIYDYIAVFKVGSMISMFKKMLERGAPFAIVVPESVEHFGEHMEKVSKEKLKQHAQKKKSETPKFMMLGTGDLAFPAIFAVSAYAQYQWIPAIAVVMGAVVGVVVNHYFLTKKFKAIPALPAIACFSIIAFAITQIPSWI